MTNIEIITALFLLWTVAVVVADRRLLVWWEELHREEVREFQQGTPVDRVLWHCVTDEATPWQAGTSWEEHGRAMTVALVRQGLGKILHESKVPDYLPVYALGYIVREEEDAGQIEALQAKIGRRDQKISDLKAELDAERQREPEASAPRAATARAQSPARNQMLEAWFRTSKPLEEFEKQYKAEEQPPQPVLKFETIPERNAAVVEYRQDHTNAETAEAFGLSVSLVKQIIHQAKEKAG